MNGGGTGTLAWRWTRTQCMGCKLGHWWACLVPVDPLDMARYVGVWSAWISPKVRALNQDLTRCDQLASQSWVQSLHNCILWQGLAQETAASRQTGPIWCIFCSPCMSSPRLSRTVRCRMQVGNKTHFFRSWWDKLSTNDHKRIQTLHTKHTRVFKTVLHMLLGVCTVSRHWPYWQHGYSLADSFSAVISTKWQMKLLRPDCGSSTCSRLLDELCLFFGTECFLPPFLPFLHISVHFTQPSVELSPFFLKAWLSCPARHLAWLTKAKTMCQRLWIFACYIHRFYLRSFGFQGDQTHHLPCISEILRFPDNEPINQTIYFDSIQNIVVLKL